MFTDSDNIDDYAQSQPVTRDHCYLGRHLLIIQIIDDPWWWLITATSLKFRQPYIKSTGAWFSNGLPRPDYILTWINFTPAMDK